MSTATSERPEQETVDYSTAPDVTEFEADNFQSFIDRFGEFKMAADDQSRTTATADNESPTLKRLRQEAKALYGMSQDLIEKGELNVSTEASTQENLEPHLGFHSTQIRYSFALVTPKGHADAVREVECVKWYFAKHLGCFGKYRKRCEERDMYLIGWDRFDQVLEQKGLDPVPGTFEILLSQEAVEEAIKSLGNTGAIERR